MVGQLELLFPDIQSGLLHHLEHATTWPGGFVVWRNPVPWRVQMLLVLGFLVAGEREQEGRTAVHITETGREFLSAS